MCIDKYHFVKNKFMKDLFKIIKTGDVLDEDIVINCLNCGYKVFLEKGNVVPKCKRCGLTKFTI